MWTAFVSFLRRLWGISWLRYVVLAVVCAALGYVSGRYAHPSRVEVREVERIVTKVETRTEYRDRIVVKKQKARIVYRDVVRTIVVAPDGTKTETTTDRSRIDTTTRADTTATTAGSSTGATETHTDRSAVKIQSSPRVRLGLLLGVGLIGPDGLIRTSPLGTLKGAPLGPALIGAEASGQIWGPVYLGGWGLTNGRDFNLGLSVGATW